MREYALQNILIIDIDDTISDAMHRENLLPDWDAFHSASNLDKPFEDMAALVDSMNGGWHIIGLTGRTEKYRTQTMKWLLDHEINVDELHMRPDDNFQPSQVYKVGVMKFLFGEDLSGLKGHLCIFIDDTEKNCEAVRALGITTLHITPGRRQS